MAVNKALDSLSFVMPRAIRGNDKRRAHSEAFGGRIASRERGALRVKAACECASLRVFSSGLPEPRVCKGPVQCALHTGAQRQAVRHAAKAPNGGHLPRVRPPRGQQGRLGAVQVAFQHQATGDHKEGLYRGAGWKVRPLRRRFPSCGLRLPPFGPEPKRQEPRRYGRQPVNCGAGSRNCQVRLALRQLSPDRARPRVTFPTFGRGWLRRNREVTTSALEMGK